MRYLYRQIKILARVCLFFLLFSLVCSFIFKGNFYVDLLSHFQISYLLVALCCLVVALFERNTRFICCSLLAVTLFSAKIVPLFYQEPLISYGEICSEVKLIQANLGADKRIYSDFKKFVQRYRPDLIFLTEFDGAWEELLAEMRGEFPFVETMIAQNGKGLAFFSKFPLEEDAKILSFDGQASGVLDISLTLKPGLLLNVLGVSLPPPTEPNSAGLRDSFIELLAERVRLKQNLSVVLGALNTSIWAHSYQPIERFTKLRNATYGQGVMGTWPASLAESMPIKLLTLPLDQTILHRALKLEEQKVLPSFGSDHLPVLSRIRVPCDLNAK